MIKRVSLDRESRTLTLWTDTGFLWLKLCRTWDGRFTWNKELLPLWGFRPQHHETTTVEAEDRTKHRTTTGWLWWIPYFMIWRLNNNQDHVVVIVPDDDPRAGTTVTVR